MAFDTPAAKVRPLPFFAFRALAPKRKLVAALVFSVAVSLLSGPLPALGACGAAAALLALSGLPPVFVARRLLSVNAFFALLWLLLPLSPVRHGAEPALFEAGPFSLYSSGFGLALLITLKGNAIAAALVALAGTSTVTENARALKRLRVPEKLVALLLITHSNLALMADEYRRLFEAARLRGFVARTSFASYATYGRLLGLLLVRSWQHAGRVGEAMRLRCFAGHFPAIPSRCSCPPEVQSRNRACSLGLLRLVRRAHCLGWSSLIGRRSRRCAGSVRTHPNRRWIQSVPRTRIDQTELATALTKPIPATGYAVPQTVPLFSLEDVSFSHEGRMLFSGVTLSLCPGERIGVVGRNGSGKSTLLHIGAGLRKPDAGIVRHKGAICGTEQDFAAARRHLGYLLQHAEDQLFCSTVLEDIAFGPYNLGRSSDEAEAMARRMLEDIGLSHLADRNGQRLSGGEQKLAAMATILVMGVDMLFLDEPTNDLDDNARALLSALIARYALPALVVSHDLPFLRETCTRFCLLEGGVLTEFDSPPR